MRYLGIDFGRKRVGLALSDESGSMAFPHGTIANDKDCNDTIERLVKEEGVGEIVIGHSVDLKGQENAVQESINELIQDLTLRIGIPIHLEPEWFTTAAATRLQGRTELKDASAAALILESFLAKQ